MQMPDNIKLAGMALAVFLLLIGWVTGLFLLVGNQSLSPLETIVLLGVEILFYLLGGLILYIFTEE